MMGRLTALFFLALASTASNANVVAGAKALSIGSDVSISVVVTGVFPDTGGHEFTVADRRAPNGPGIYVSAYDAAFEAGTGPVGFGNRIILEGRIDPGEFMPIIHATRIEACSEEEGDAEMGAAPCYSLGELVGGVRDSMRARLRGVVQRETVNQDRGIVYYEVASRDGAFLATASVGQRIQGSVVDADVSFSGVVTSIFNSRGEWTGANLMVQGDGIRIDKPAADNPFSAPSFAIGSIASGAIDDSSRLHRRRTAGRVTLSRSSYFFIQSIQGGGLRVNIAPGVEPPPPDVDVDVAGFLSRGGVFAGLSDAVWKECATCDAVSVGPVLLEKMPPYRLGGGDAATLDGSLVTLKARLRGVETPLHRNPLAWIDFDGCLVEAELPSNADVRTLKDLPAGCAVNATGVFVSQHSERSVDVPSWSERDTGRLLLRGAEDIALRDDDVFPSPLFVRDMVRIAVALVAALLAFLSWLCVRRRRQLQALERSAAEREAAMKAVMEDRIWLSADIHDSIQQDLAAAALHFEAASRAMGGDATASLGEGRSSLARARIAVRDIVWDLRSNMRTKRGDGE